MILVVMGVSGSGKSTVARRVAQHFGWDFQEGDDLHTPQAVAKMKAGQALNDADREPWLQAIADWIDAQRRARRSGVVTCSGLKRKYRLQLAGGHADVRLLYLRASEEAIGERVAERSHAFMPASLLHSQFEALEEPGADERPLVVDSDRRTPAQTVDAAIAQVAAAKGGGEG